MAGRVIDMQIRDQVFELRRAGHSWPVIAAELGISRTSAQREFNRRANEIARADGAPQNSNPYPALSLPTLDPSLAADPDIKERQRQLALKRLTLQESDLELREVEQRQRMAILKGGGEGNQSQVAVLLLSEVSRLRDEIRDRPAKDSGTLIDQLAQLKTLGNTIASFAPPSTPSSPAEVEFKVALARINLEEQRLAKDREAEISQRQQVAQSENMRNDAIARFVEGFGPMLSQVTQRWLEERTVKPAPVALPAPTATAAPTEAAGSCPICGVALVMSPGGEPEKCPGCGSLIQLVEGKITQAGRSANGQPSKEIPRFAS